MNSAPDEMRAAWNERYAAGRHVFGVAPNQLVEAELGDLVPGRALDLACGQGRNAVWLAKRGHQVTAVDFSDVAIEHARLLADEAGVAIDFHVGDLMDWIPPVGEYDLVLLSYLQLPQSTRRAVHERAIDALAPNGLLMLIAHHVDNLDRGIGGPPTPEVLFDEVMLESDFAELEIIRNEQVLRQAEVEGVAGDAVDILFVARKRELSGEG